jgi:hypothetical protein
MLNILCVTVVYIYFCVDYICYRATCLLHMQGMGHDNLYVFIYSLTGEFLFYDCLWNCYIIMLGWTSIVVLHVNIFGVTTEDILVYSF